MIARAEFRIEPPKDGAIEVGPGVVATPDPSQLDCWHVSVDGEPPAHVSREGNRFVSWHGGRSDHWSFSQACKYVAERVRFFAAEAAKSRAKREAFNEWARSLTEAEVADQIAATEAGIDSLKYAGWQTNAREEERRMRAHIDAIRKARAA